MALPILFDGRTGAQIAADINAELGAAQGAATRRIAGVNAAFFGDSITGFGFNYPGYASILSMGRIRNAGLFSHSGYTSSQLVPLISQVTELLPAPNFCVLLIGTNDALTSVPVSNYRANMIAMIDSLISAYVTPVLCTIPPQGDSTRRGAVNQINAQLALIARSYGLSLIDFYGALVDPVTGSWAAGFDSNDGTHPSDSARLLMGRLVSQKLSAQTPEWSPHIAQDSFDTQNLFPNAMGFVDDNANGVADGWSNWNPGRTGVAYALDVDATIKGRWMTQTLSSANGVGFLGHRKIGGFSAGDQLEFTMLVKTESLAGASSQLWAYVIWWADFGGTIVRTDVLLSGMAQNVEKGLVTRRFIAPAGSTQVSLEVKPGPGNGAYSIAQPTCYNLTAMGIV